MYTVYYSPDPSQESLLSGLLSARHQLATLCGYETFSERAVTHSLAQSPSNIASFLARLAHQLPDRLQLEYKVWGWIFIKETQENWAV